MRVIARKRKREREAGYDKEDRKAYYTYPRISSNEMISFASRQIL